MGSLGSDGSPAASAAVSTGVEQDDLLIPVIDFSAFLHGDAKTKQGVSRAILHAFQTSGFLYLSHHGIPSSTVDTVFSHSAKFFQRPQSEKDALAWTDAESNRGYVTFGREKVTQSSDPDEIAALRAANPDLKETMEIGREGVENMPNQWPSGDADAETFTSVMKSFFLTCQTLHVQVMRAIALGMGFDEDFFDSFTVIGDNTLRLLHYPPVLKSAVQAGQVRAGAHSDYGDITLLFQDDTGGLEVLSPQNTWVRAVPIKDTIVVNAGDLLARWSNDTIKSTMHRVVQPKEPSPQDAKNDDPKAMYDTRYSIAYFCNPDFEKVIEALPRTYADEKDKKYGSILSGEYLAMRLAATY